MSKVLGIKSVDIKIKAIGNGVVNWNGTQDVKNHDSDSKTKTLSNHMMPKLKGYTNKVPLGENGEYRGLKTALDIDFKVNPMYISQNCIRNQTFKDESYDFHFASKKDSGKDPKKLLLSVSGLLRGYVIPNTQCKRKSPLLIEDFVDQLGNGNFEQFANSGAKDSNSIYSKTTFGKTEYLSNASISIEDLQFISLDKKFSREALAISDKKEGEKLAKELTDFIKSLDPSYKGEVLAEYGSYSRIGSIYNEAEVGILLNDSAIDILVKLMLEMLENLSFTQAKNWMSVDKLTVDYNDSNSMFRILKSLDSISEEKHTKYAVYYKIGA